MPSSPDIIGLPNAAIGGGDVEYIGLRNDAGRGNGASAAERSNHPPAQPRKVRRECLASQRYCAENKVSESMHGNRV
jgi:hypothetical protein